MVDGDVNLITVSPDEGEGDEEAGEEAPEDVEEHVGGEAGHCKVLHCVEPKKADTNEEKPAVDLMRMRMMRRRRGRIRMMISMIDDDLFKCETVSRIKAETEENNEEEEAEAENLESDIPP